ncbi:3-hydroxyacyl-CoA dehydrogenase family protein [Bradyrhizobium sp. 200]|uniref:3-hydroxyacyl-CoA dehydrogenase family protein n=1 Tax=Bradyrhizobium sp. 200 TaxID=2782665 RepID=UPI00200009E2|nr:3-hydroxyacyl-CoA dehydrogenase family protein [Bradyrhizobium sp. 200]UPJ48428.1 3-hydroxyacyl-CoA dehydrogenase family protein [Bradyrhizobium sp. 200]
MVTGKERIGVIGAGLMGAEIAFVHAVAGHDVILCDKIEDALSRATRRLNEIYDKGASRSFYDPHRKSEVLGAIRTTVDMRELADREVVIEAVFEQQTVKEEVLKAIDRICRPGCLIATNTSTIPISVLASFVSPERRARFVGTHYFSPVSRMKLVEVIPAIETDEMTVSEVMQLCGDIGKTPVRIKDVTGFAVNRLLHVLMIEAVRLVEEGVATPEDIDLACRLGLGHPMGPFELMDATTSSLCLQAQQIMFDAYGERFRPRPLLKQRVQAGYVGGRGRKGWRN